MTKIDSLIEYFREFPGIGPRQARRFVYFLLSRNNNYLNELSTLITEIKREMKICNRCQRYFTNNSAENICAICRDQNRDTETLIIVEKDVDLENLERSADYNGFYFVLGSLIPILEKNPEKRARLSELGNVIRSEYSKNLKEIIFAFAVNAEGENTADYLRNFIKGTAPEREIKFSTLGRGLSTGLELEYSDNETLKNALKNRA